MENQGQKSVKHECNSCGGTGLYVGFAERDGAAVVCSSCNGKGWEEFFYTEFTERKLKEGVTRVFQTNVGVLIGQNSTFKLSDFGGMPLEYWLSGKEFGIGTENRISSCPLQWAQATRREEPDFPECSSCIGMLFKDCDFYPEKSKCWNKWDLQRGKKDENQAD